MDDRIPDSPPNIAPVPPGMDRPLWSVMIPSYNCSQYLPETLQSVLLQDEGPERMQIEVVDDASTDSDVAGIVNEYGKGRIGFYRQEKNRGSLRNFETCLNRAKGHWIHLLHGDDLVLPGFYQKIENLFHQYPQAAMACTGFHYINEEGVVGYDNDEIAKEEGIIPNWLDKIASGQRLQTPAVVVQRKVYEQLGGFFGVHYGEDWEMWVRIAAHFNIVHSPERLAQYRVHHHNITSRYFIEGKSIGDVDKVINIIQPYLPPEKRAALKKEAKRNFSIYFAKLSDKVYHEFKRPDMAVLQAKRALQMDLNKTTAFFLIKTFVKKMIHYKFGTFK